MVTLRCLSAAVLAMCPAKTFEETHHFTRRKTRGANNLYHPLLSESNVHLNLFVCVCVCVYVYRVSQEEWTKLRESVPYVKIYRYNPKHLYPKLNGYGDNGQRSLKV